MSGRRRCRPGLAPERTKMRTRCLLTEEGVETRKNDWN